MYVRRASHGGAPPRPWPSQGRGGHRRVTGCRRASSTFDGGLTSVLRRILPVTAALLCSLLTLLATVRYSVGFPTGSCALSCTSTAGGLVRPRRAREARCPPLPWLTAFGGQPSARACQIGWHQPKNCQMVKMRGIRPLLLIGPGARACRLPGAVKALVLAYLETANALLARLASARVVGLAYWPIGPADRTPGAGCPRILSRITQRSNG